MRAKNKLVHGVGVNDLEVEVSAGDEVDQAWQAWQSMITRCYSTRFQLRCPTYIGCIVDPQWHRLSVFKAWFDKRYHKGYQLDKDIMVPGNTVYGPDTCVLVPAYVNNLLCGSADRQDQLPRGVTKHGTGYKAQCQGGNTCERLRKTFKTPEEAAAWYQATKSRVIRRVATDALARREIDLRTHLALGKHADLIRDGHYLVLRGGTPLVVSASRVSGRANS